MFILSSELNKNIIQNLINLLQHKLYKNSGFSDNMTLGNCFIILILKFFNLTFNWNVFKYRFPFR